MLPVPEGGAPRPIRRHKLKPKPKPRPKPQPSRGDQPTHHTPEHASTASKRQRAKTCLTKHKTPKTSKQQLAKRAQRYQKKKAAAKAYQKQYRQQNQAKVKAYNKKYRQQTKNCGG